MQCWPVSSGQRKIRTLVSSGRRKGRGWHLCTSITNLLVSDRFYFIYSFDHPEFKKADILLLFLTSSFHPYNLWFILFSSHLVKLCSRSVIFPLPSTSGSYAGRAKIEGATLTIHSVNQKDSGEYRCEVTASEDHVSLGEATVTLNVLGVCLCAHVNMHIHYCAKVLGTYIKLKSV